MDLSRVSLANYSHALPFQICFVKDRNHTLSCAQCYKVPTALNPRNDETQKLIFTTSLSGFVDTVGFEPTSAY